MALPEEISSQLPEDIRGNESLQQFNDVGGLAKSYIETKQMVGGMIRYPAKDSKPEDVEKWAGETSGRLKDYGLAVTKLGDRPPEKPEAYEFKLDGVDAEALKADPAVGWFRGVAHELGLSNVGANRFLDRYTKEFLPKMADAAKANEVEMIEDDAGVEKALSQRFKGDTGKVRELRDRAIQNLSSDIPDLKDFLEGTAPNGKAWMANKNHPAMVDLLSRVAESQQQDFGGNVGSLPPGTNMADVENRIVELRASAESAVNDSERERVGDLLVTEYKKKDALLKRRA